MDWDLYSYVISSKRRTQIVLALKEEATPTQIAKSIGDISVKNVSKLLSGLRNYEVVECITPNARKGRVYTLTKGGKEILGKLVQEKAKGSKVNL